MDAREMAARLTQPVVCVVMGVSGSGKTTVAALLAGATGWPFEDGDDLHPPANIAKMRGGTPLDDEDRWPWLASIAAVIDGWRGAGMSGIVACSALKRVYRDILVGGRPDVALIYLRASHDAIAGRMVARHGHFMPAQLLDSQFATLEEPGPDEHPVVVGGDGPPREAVAAVIQALAEREQAP